MKAKLIAAAACGLLLSGTVQAAELKVLASGAVKEAYTELIPQFEKSSGNKVTITWAGTVDIKKKIATGEVYDLVIIASSEIDGFIKDGKIVTPGVPVATLVRSGEAEIGFQQVSELIHEPGIDFLGALPNDVQKITTFSGGIHAGSKEQAAAKALQTFLTAPANAATLKKHGLSPG